MPDKSYSVQPITDDFEEFASISGESLLATDPAIWTKIKQRVGPKNYRGIYDQDQQLLGGLGLYRMKQWFGGQAIACAGITGVAIEVGSRGTRACDTLLRSTLRELYQEGTPIASLYPSTQRLYRGVGFEQAGTRTQYRVPLAGIRWNDRELPVHRSARPPISALEHCASERGRQSNGNLLRTPGLWSRQLEPLDDQPTFTYLIGDREQPVGFAILASAQRSHGVPQPLVVHDLAANTPEATRRLWTLLRDHRGIRDTVQWCGSPNDPMLYATDEVFTEVDSYLRWMLRIVNVPAAVEARGFPVNLEMQFSMQIEDELLQTNQGCWQVSVGDGRAKVGTAEQADITMDVGTLATLYSGFHSASELAAMGRLRASSRETLAIVDAVFAGPTPWIPEIF